jgi:translocation and assembly module TamB
VNLTLQGGAPLSLANERLRPNSVTGLLTYDLAVNGPPDLSSVSGVLSTNGARVVLPGAGLALGDLAATVRLSGGRAQIEAQAGLSSGGQVALSGPVTLSGAFPAELTATLRGATLSQRNLYETTADGQVTLNGPLTGGAQIGGTINLGTVELRIPESLGPTFANLPNLEHRGESAASRQTRLWAGMIADPNAAPAGAGVSYPIDLLINAPSRIFVRGRGLDAELGGRLRLTGTTADLIPQGQFDLVRGRFNILGKRLDLTEGLVSLQGAFDPYIRFIAETEAAGSAIRIGLEGVASEPELTLTSSPELPQDEVLALLLFGRSITDISALQAVQLAGAVRTLSGRGNGLSEGLRSSIGVDDLDLSTTDTGETEARVGKYISDNIYTDLTVNTAGETQINLNLNVSRSITVRGRLNSDGGTGIGIYIERDY